MKEFSTRYQSFLLKEQPYQYPKKLTGLTEQHNSHNGFFTETPTLIGDTDLAKTVFLNGQHNNINISILKNIEPELQAEKPLRPKHLN
ncbi:hypothetical protein D5018_20900 [Parashewanella curva]|uniref:DUF6475 domain-containing protein n=1 Tax=Parashewanella curva TaxID=2338552 RepID=A0A3L8PQX1_9GAMM|nr:DUF6475 domain-containing protein [Parashewanella curva]RLV57746.1 hypothetical protein D5018_20900 [Parashewanella curva]